MAEELRAFRSDLEVELVPSSGGRFEVTYEGTLIYSKLQLKRFPNPGEVPDLIANA